MIAIAAATATHPPKTASNSNAVAGEEFLRRLRVVPVAAREDLPGSAN
jgi:hypothetical protein